MMVCRQCGTANENTQETCRRCGAELHPPHMRGKIACVVHANREATTTCNGCGRRLCDACAFTSGGIDFCEGCAPEGAVSTGHDTDYERFPVLNTLQVERADFDSRCIALAIDLAVEAVGCGALWGILGMLLKRWNFATDPRHQGAAFVIFWLLCGIFVLAYQIALIALRGQTVGKQQAAVIILTREGKILNLKQALARGGASLLSLAPLGLGYLWAMWDKEGETWHDKLSKTAAFRYVDVK